MAEDDAEKIKPANLTDSIFLSGSVNKLSSQGTHPSPEPRDPTMLGDAHSSVLSKDAKDIKKDATVIGPAGQQVTAPGANLQADGRLLAGIRADAPGTGAQGTTRPEQANLQSSLQDLTDKLPAQAESDKFQQDNELSGR